MTSAPDSRLYVGVRRRDHVSVVRVDEGQTPVELPARFDLRNHSPDGFEWGYSGSGPAQLALAIVADATGDNDQAQLLYQDFKDAVVAHLDHDGWEIDAGWVKLRLLEIMGEC